MTVLSCITNEHNGWLVMIAVCVCFAGSWTIIGLFNRALATTGLQRAGWHFLTAVAAGASIWCTHFIAMLAYEPGVPVAFDPAVTFVSLLIAVAGAAAGFAIAGSNITRLAPLFGGGTVGLAVVAMHYTGMLAYRVQGIVEWDGSYLVASIVASVVFSALALAAASAGSDRRDRLVATGLMVVAIVSLHFTAMTAFRVSPMIGDDTLSDPGRQALALGIAGVALLIVGAGLASFVIDDQVRTESLERLRHVAMNDALTGVSNRVGFNDRLDCELDLASKAGTQVALIGIDLDRFKEVNDLRGHSAGDEVLKALALRMKGILRKGEFVARVGGDEFAALQRMPDRSDLNDFLSRLEAVFSHPVQLGGYNVLTGASIGVAIYPDDATDREALVHNADLAMYSAKATITRSVCFYERSMDEIVRARRSLVNELREAVENNRLDIHYQVQRSVATGQIRGYEALLRWDHPQRGFIPPAEIIPLAEESGLILQIGEWVLRTACAEAASWEPPYKIAVNLSPVQFAHVDLPKLVREVLRETGLSPDRLELELTESAIIADKARSLPVLRQIKALGVTIALDDFGTGYSSLETLRAFPFDKIKLDRSFMNQVELSPQANAILRAVVALGKSLDIPVLAEGIETHGQFLLLTAAGCDEAQGYFVGYPAPIEQIVRTRQINPIASHKNKTVQHAPSLTFDFAARPL